MKPRPTNPYPVTLPLFHTPSVSPSIFFQTFSAATPLTEQSKSQGDDGVGKHRKSEVYNIAEAEKESGRLGVADS